MNNEQGCPFCAIAAGRAPADHYRLVGVRCVAFTPLNPVTQGHTLVVPRRHVPNACADPDIAGVTMRAAAMVAQTMPAANILTSVGEAATQTVEHLHLHVLPRYPGDGLRLPWPHRTDKP